MQARERSGIRPDLTFEPLFEPSRSDCDSRRRGARNRPLWQQRDASYDEYYEHGRCGIAAQREATLLVRFVQ